jgi:hypothetical protein
MALNAKAIVAEKKRGRVQPNLEPGGYPARVVQIIDLGLQPQRPYQGKDKPPAHEIMLTYELVDEFMLDENDKPLKDKPRWVSETLPFYGLQADKAKSTLRYNALDPVGAHDGNFAALINSPCTVTIVNNKNGDKVYDNVGAVSTMRPREAANCPDLVNPPKVFDLDAPDMEVFNSLPEWLRDKIKGNLNFKGSALERKLGGEEPVKKADKTTPPWQDSGEANPY